MEIHGKSLLVDFAFLGEFFFSKGFFFGFLFEREKERKREKERERERFSVRGRANGRAIHTPSSHDFFLLSYLAKIFLWDLVEFGFFFYNIRGRIVWKDGWMDGWKDRWKDARMDGSIDRSTDEINKVYPSLLSSK